MMLSTLSIAMGVCASCGISEQEKADQERQAAVEQKRQAAEQKRLAAEQRRLVIEASEPIRLLSASPEFELLVHEANTVLEVLEIRAEQMGLPKAAAAWLKLEFSEAIILHHKTLKEAGLCDQAKISVQGEDEAKAKQEQAGKVDILDAAEQGKADEVQLVLAIYPDRVNAKDGVTVPAVPLAAADSVLLDGQNGRAPLHFAASSNHCQVAEILIAAGADLNAKDEVRNSPWHASCRCC